ncbi:hypothetical protein H7H78_12060 [Mycobacterium shinjukuense]|nr:hypothetical protein [Mycobacterium shinjukuense]
MHTNSAEMAVDTLSAPAANSRVVGTAAAALAALIAEPIAATSEAAVISASGAAMTNDILRTSELTEPGPPTRQRR